jgi:DNA-binding MarR family transcriptional regulator
LAVLKRRTEPHGITLTQYFLLRHLWDDEGINQSELSERLGTTQPATVATVDSLEKRRLIKRVRSTDDRRMVRLYLTAKGRTLRDTLLDYARELSLQALDGVGPSDVVKLRALLGLVRGNLTTELTGSDEEERGA